MVGGMDRRRVVIKPQGRIHRQFEGNKWMPRNWLMRWPKRPALSNEGSKERLAGGNLPVIVVAMPNEQCIPMLKALADETRWRIVRELLANPLTVGELVKRLDVSQYNVSKHVRILREAGILETERAGKHVECRVAEDFRKRLARRGNVLDLGCCTFRFD